MENTITAFLLNHTECTTQEVYQYNQGMILQIVGPELSGRFTADFANAETGDSVSAFGENNAVEIPDALFIPGQTIHVWIVLTSIDYAVTRYHIRIPISARANRTGATPSPHQQDIIERAISMLETAVEQTGQDAQTASAAKDEAVSAQAGAVAANQAAQAAEADATAAKTEAQTAQAGAQTAQSAAEQAAQTAVEHGFTLSVVANQDGTYTLAKGMRTHE